MSLALAVHTFADCLGHVYDPAESRQAVLIVECGSARVWDPEKALFQNLAELISAETHC